MGVLYLCVYVRTWLNASVCMAVGGTGVNLVDIMFEFVCKCLHAKMGS